ncbi:hypothetical protein [Pseudomonas phage Pa2]|uniref:Uncharacterized protein n=2 Tax=Litunavirus Ab09 TaxID=1920765 RepID=A0A0A7NRR0_9CAUD|nr:hypothetical protein ACQ21_gp79 [Pseudomonas phage Pa2]AIZ94921.1 hypothetical protein [Pseudomonas phage Pa2]AIZ95013.1 hypothetical protein [Pseudomonas phage phi176]WRN92303.1 hypothetical protein [Pseudomonas phage vB_Pae_HMKU_23]
MNEEQAIQITRKNAEKFVRLRDAMLRLHKNRDFQALILNDFLKDNAARLVLLKADKNMESPEMQARIIREIDAVGALHTYFQLIGVRGDEAEQAIKDCDSELERVREEEDEE